MSYRNIRTVAAYQDSDFFVETDLRKGQRVARRRVSPLTGKQEVYKREYHKQVILADGEEDNQLYILEDQTTHREVTKATMLKTHQRAYKGDKGSTELAELFPQTSASTSTNDTTALPSLYQPIPPLYTVPLVVS